MKKIRLLDIASSCGIPTAETGVREQGFVANARCQSCWPSLIRFRNNVTKLFCRVTLLQGCVVAHGIAGYRRTIKCAYLKKKRKKNYGWSNLQWELS